MSAVANRSRGFCDHAGASISTAKRKNVRPSRPAASRACIPVTRLSPAAIKQAPTKYTQNLCHGIHGGTIDTMPAVTVKCSVPKAATGAA